MSHAQDDQVQGSGFAASIGLTGLIGFLYFPAFLIMAHSGSTITRTEEFVMRVMTLGQTGFQFTSDAFLSKAVIFSVISLVMMIIGTLSSGSTYLDRINLRVVSFLSLISYPVIIYMVIQIALNSYSGAGYNDVIDAGLIIYLSGFSFISVVLRDGQRDFYKTTISGMVMSAVPAGLRFFGLACVIPALLLLILSDGLWASYAKSLMFFDRAGGLDVFLTNEFLRQSRELLIFCATLAATGAIINMMGDDGDVAALKSVPFYSKSRDFFSTITLGIVAVILAICVVMVALSGWFHLITFWITVLEPRFIIAYLGLCFFVAVPIAAFYLAV